jgi:hypothetical protein
MESTPPRIGQAVTAVGGILTAISVYQPWYGLGFTSAAVGAAELQIRSIPGLAPYAAGVGAQASTFAGHSVVGLSAHQVLHHISVVLLVIGAVAILAGLAGLVSTRVVLPVAAGQLLAALGFIGLLLTVYRMVSPPNPEPELITLTLKIGSVMSLIGCAAIMAGAVWPAHAAAASEAPADPAGVWSELSGWTPS